MKLLGLLFLLFGGILLALYVLYHIVIFLISGSPLLLKGGVLSVIVGFLILLIAAMVEKEREKRKTKADK